MKEESDWELGSTSDKWNTKFVKAYDMFYNSMKIKSNKKKSMFEDDESCADLRTCEEGKVNPLQTTWNLKNLQQWNSKKNVGMLNLR